MRYVLNIGDRVRVTDAYPYDVDPDDTPSPEDVALRGRVGIIVGRADTMEMWEVMIDAHSREEYENDLCAPVLFDERELELE